MKKHLSTMFVVAALCGAWPAPRSWQGPPAAPTAPIAPAKPAALDAAALEKKVDDLLHAHVTVNRFSGSILLASGGKPLVAKGYGYANREWQIPNTPDTKFRIGSITKQFTSMLIMQLREQGRLKLEDSVCAYLAPCPDAWKPVTIHHLLTHTSGIPTYTGMPAWRATNMAPKSIDQMLSLFRDLPLKWVSGERFEYNNSGYFLLGVVIEKITGKTYELVLGEQIFTPLGMHNTGYDWSKPVIPKRASGYSVNGSTVVNTEPLDMQQPYSAGSLYSTVEDLLIWDQALRTEKLLPAAARQIMWTPFRDNYAYGWIIPPPAPQLFGGHRRQAHGGGINGFSSTFVRLSEPNVTVAVLANIDAVNTGAIGRDLAAIYFGQPYTIPVARSQDRDDQ